MGEEGEALSLSSVFNKRKMGFWVLVFDCVWGLGFWYGDDDYFLLSVSHGLDQLCHDCLVREKS